MALKKCLFIFQLIFLIVSISYAGNTVIPEIPSIAKTIYDSLEINKKKIVAITDFTDLEGNINPLGRFLAEEISISLTSSGKEISIIDRNQIKKMLADKGISTTGVIDPGFAKQIGKFSGAEVIITGSAYPVSDSLYLSVKVIDVETARIFAGTSTTIKRSQVIDELISVSFKIPEIVQPTVQKTSFTPQVKESYDFVFILKEAKMSENTMTLNFEIKNNSEQARYLTIDSIKAIDDNGRIYYPSSLVVGQSRAYIGNSGKIQSVNKGIVSENFDVWLERYQQIKAQITLRNISTRAKTIGFLEMTVASVNIMDNLGTFMRLEDDLSSIQFTNIPVIRERDGS